MNYDRLGAPPSILIVDDQAGTILLLKEAIGDLGNVFFATSGGGALAFVAKQVPDVVLLDIEMPGLDGYAVCRAIKSDPRLKDVDIIFVTSHDNDVNELHALSMGGADFLPKPLNVPIARARIKAHLALRLKTKLLTLARQDLEDVVQNLPAFVAHWNADLQNDLCNDASGNWFSVPAAQMLGMHLRTVLGETNYLAIEAQLQAVLRGENVSFDLTLQRRDGQLLYGQVSLVCRHQATFDAGFLMLITDVTERKLAELALYDEKERIRITLNAIGDAVIATDAEGIVTFLNPIAESMTGWMGKEVIGQPIEYVMQLRDVGTNQPVQNPVRLALKEQRVVGMALNCALLRRDGRLFDVEDSAAPIFDHTGTIIGTIIVFHDVSEARAMAIKMTHLANHDALTSLPNRMLLQDRTQQALFQASRNGSRVAMLLLDLDHFKSINDSLGHTTGDHLLQQIANRLKDALRSCDTVSRQGGDEFIVLMPELESIEQIGKLAARLLHVVSEPYWVGETRFDLSVSIGIGTYPDDSADLEALYRHADAAMYRAKQEGRNRFLFFSPEIEEAMAARHLLERHMRAAVERADFEVHYQPKIDANTGQTVGAEALVRWRNSEGKLISPAQFIPLAEETGLIVPLGHFVLRQACLHAKRWHDAGFEIRIAVNVSAVQFADSTFIETVRQVIEETEIEAEFLELEITEGVLAKDVEDTLISIGELKAQGVSIAIDDFGTGYSSLTYLKQFPIDVIKIDQSFVREMLFDKSSAAIVQAIVNMAIGLDLRLVAEGVEEEEQSQGLLALGCHIMQGYLYGKPMPFDDMTRFLEASASSQANNLSPTRRGDENV
ncbi:MAG: EAL domain-containing protein [Burkholderiales bacterium]|nr:EAL domain-containing protein [Burkholderiales bacterium]